MVQRRCCHFKQADCVREGHTVTNTLAKEPQTGQVNAILEKTYTDLIEQYEYGSKVAIHLAMLLSWNAGTLYFFFIIIFLLLLPTYLGR